MPTRSYSLSVRDTVTDSTLTWQRPAACKRAQAGNVHVRSTRSHQPYQRAARRRRVAKTTRALRAPHTLVLHRVLGSPTTACTSIRGSEERTQPRVLCTSVERIEPRADRYQGDIQNPWSAKQTRAALHHAWL